jgi:hypothetical protein
MSRRSLVRALALVALLLLTVGTGLGFLLRFEPRHHRNAEISPSKERSSHSITVTRKLSDLWNEITTREPNWSQSFTDEQINSFLSEGFIKQGLAEKLLPEGISEPRVTFEQDRMRLSFRYRSKVLSTVVSVDLRTWVTSSETNVLAVCIEGLHAGAVPFKAQWLLERLSEAARQHDIDISWYRHDGHPVAILRFQANQARPTLKLRHVRIEPGMLTIHGESTERTRTAMNVPDGDDRAN